MFHFTLRSARTSLEVSFRGITPDRLASLPIESVATRSIEVGNTRRTLESVVEIEPTAGPELVISGATELLVGVGAEMDSGSIVVNGSVGPAAAEQMTGGTLRIHGSAGDGLGRSMQGGLVQVEGDVGDHVGGPIPGELLGMRGGTIVVDGDAGDHLATSMRRGTILVHGKAGAGLARSMRGGTVVCRSADSPIGCGLIRGTLVLGDEAAMPATYRQVGWVEPVFWKAFRRWVEQCGLQLPAFAMSDRLERWTGDHAALGKGELLRPAC